MPNSEIPAILYHEEPELFEAALSFTASQTGFSPRLVEKDYYCTLLLGYLAGVEGLVFKGGTCLAKVHAAFYRLSEDLDFVIPAPCDATRGKRRAQAAALKAAVAQLPDALPAFRVKNALRGANESTQYLATLAYDSIVTGEDATIEVEVGLREPLLDPALTAPAATILIDPGMNVPRVPPVRVTCMSLRESLAEKSRAALSRREPAIRDFFDLDYAVRKLHMDLAAPELLAMIAVKLRVPGNGPVDVGAARLAALRAQIRTRLEPVLKPAELAAFDLDRAFTIVTRMASKLGVENPS
jgi:predicted nucleotidyltransferase component of viral defense system